MRTTRRDALRMLAAGVAGGTLLPRLAMAERESKRPSRIERVGLQLYTVRKAMAKDLEGTIAAVAAVGVHELEFAGYYNKPPVWWRGVLKRYGLTAPSTHIALPAKDDDWVPLFAQAKEMEHNWVMVPFVGQEFRTGVDGWKRLADRLNAGGMLARKAGLNFGYHNHDFEFAPVGNTTGYEILTTNTDKAHVDLELDLYWAVKAGQDPVALIKRWSGRYTCFHMKDAGPPPARAMLDVGAGTIDFPKILAAGRAQGLKHWFIEHDEPKDAMASVQASAAAMLNY